jgi:hypothetical protein
MRSYCSTNILLQWGKDSINQLAPIELDLMHKLHCHGNTEISKTERTFATSVPFNLDFNGSRLKKFFTFGSAPAKSSRVHISGKSYRHASTGLSSIAKRNRDTVQCRVASLRISMINIHVGAEMQQLH